MTTEEEQPDFGIEDPDTTVETPRFEIDDEATIETGSLPPPGPDVASASQVEGSPGAAQGGASTPEGARLRTPAEIAELVEEGRGFVEPLARRIHRRVGGRGDVEELGAVGRFALVEAARAYDPTRARFAPYALKRLEWAMIDHLRRDVRRRGTARLGTALAVAERVRDAPVEPPTGAELPTEETSRAALVEAFASHANALAVGLVLGGATSPRAEPSPDSTMNPERAVGDRRNIERLRAAIAELPDDQRAIVVRHYEGDERFDHIAESLGISKSWASRLHARAMATLARALGSR